MGVGRIKTPRHGKTLRLLLTAIIKTYGTGGAKRFM
jgi:hypothetical protein